MAGEFEGKTVLVTGAAGYIGSAVSRRFAAEGAKLVLAGRTPEPLNALADSLAAETTVEPVDVTREDQVEALVQRIEARSGRIDVLVHTVGGFRAGQAVYEPGLELLDAMWNLNVRPVYLVLGRVARHMIEREVKGNLVAVVARSALRGSAKTAAYTASKAAALRIIESLALEVRDRGIHVNAVSPSTVDTPENRADMAKADFSKWVEPEELADAILFLSSPRSAGIFGTNLEVYGRV
jgi:NAD(P)-dependent dehydrogenase (short-subunit alcohol dehydrogenase family)